MTAGATALRRLSRRMGILDGYRSQEGRPVTTRDGTRVALLAALGIDASTPVRARVALRDVEEREREQWLPGARVLTAPTAIATLDVAMPRGAKIAGARLDGQDPVRVRRVRGAMRLTLGTPVPHGWHDLEIDANGSRHTQRLLIAPPGCPAPSDVLRGRRVWGVIANLYTVRSATNWGAGNIGDLERLLQWTAQHGGAFVGVNPLHAIRNRGEDISPYGPLSRLYRNPLYIDPARIPEWQERPDQATLQEAARLREGPEVPYDAVQDLLFRTLETLHARFRASPPNERRRAYEAYCAREGAPLHEFAIFSAIDEHLRSTRQSAWWGDWPEELRDPSTSAVRELAAKLEDRVDLHRWIQFELDRQLGGVGSAARDTGLPVGLYQDLAIGVPGSAADVWSRQALFARGVSIGAPPDLYSATGQTWGLVPLNPIRLVHEDRLEYWSALVRSALRHAGALRMDHVLGLFRQFWIPDGADGKDGGYVRFPRDELLGVLAWEASQAGAIIVGEDLGTVPPEVPPTLEAWNILSSRVMYFEHGRRGYRPAREYPRNALATANTHDHAPIAGYWTERDVDLRASLGTLPPRTARATRVARARERGDMLVLLREEGLLPGDAVPEPAELVEAIHAFLRRTPCWLVGLALDDLGLEDVQVNVPGVPVSKHRSWSRRMADALETLLVSEAVVRRLGEERRWSSGP